MEEQSGNIVRTVVPKRRPAAEESRGEPDPPSSEAAVRLVGLAAASAAVLYGALAADRGQQSRIGAWGLVQALPGGFFVAVGVLTISFFAQLLLCQSSATARSSLRPLRPSLGLVLAIHVVGLVVLLHGAPAFLESEPRFATAWLHAGFTDQILTHGASRPEVDARFNWPGFFATMAGIAGAAGVDDPVLLLRWAPVAAVLLYLPPLYLIGRHLTSSKVASWVGLFLYVPVNWVGQDYFAPQTMGFLLYLWCIAILVLFFREGPQLALGRHHRTWLSRLPFDGRPDESAGPRLRVALLALLVLLMGALAVSHQLSPVMVVFATTGLVLAGRLRLVAFPVLAMVLTLGWLSLGATTYWVGHLDVIFGNLGNLRVSLGGVQERVTGSDEHLVVIRVRLLFSLVVWLAMGACALQIWRRTRRAPVTLLVLALAPMAAITQRYGGEAVLRIFLFSSPFACLVIAQAATVLRLRALALVGLTVVALGLSPVFFLMRYGNEGFEQVRPGEVRALEWLYDVAPLGSNVISPTSQIPWRFVHAADYNYGRPTHAPEFRRGDLGSIRGPIGRQDAGAPATYLVVTEGIRIYGTEALGEPPGWFEDVVQPRLTPENGYHVVYKNPDAVIYQFQSDR